MLIVHLYFFLLARHDKSRRGNSSRPTCSISVVQELAVRRKMKCSLLASSVTPQEESDDTAAICMSFTLPGPFTQGSGLIITTTLALFLFLFHAVLAELRATLWCRENRPSCSSASLQHVHWSRRAAVAFLPMSSSICVVMYQV